MKVESSASTTASPRATSSHGRGLPEGGVDASDSIRPRAIVRRNVDVHVDATIFDFALCQLHVLEHEKLRRCLELVNESPDVSIFARQRHSIDEIHQLAVALRLGFRVRALHPKSALLRDLLNSEERDSTSRSHVGRQDLVIELLQLLIGLALALDRRLSPLTIPPGGVERGGRRG